VAQGPTNRILVTIWFKIRPDPQFLNMDPNLGFLDEFLDEIFRNARQAQEIVISLLYWPDGSTSQWRFEISDHFQLYTTVS